MAKVIPIGRPQSTRERFIEAVGATLAAHGFSGLTPDNVALRAGLRKEFIRRIFGTFAGLVTAYGRSHLFWPSALELMADRQDQLRALPPERQMAWFFKEYYRALRRRPETVRILAWELHEGPHRYTPLLEYPRVRCALEFFELLREDTPDDVDLSAIVVVLAGAVHHLLVMSLTRRHFGGVDLNSEQGRSRIEQAIDLLLHQALSAPRLNGEQGQPGS